MHAAELLLPINQICHIDTYAEAHPRQVGCIRLARGESSLAPSPTFVFGAMPDYLTHSLFGSLNSEAIGCYVIRNGRLGYDAILAHGETALWTLAFNHDCDYVQSVMSRPPPEGCSIRHLRGAAACIHGPGYNVYGHWLVDFLPRLSVLIQAGYDITRLRYILPHDCPSFGLKFLQLLGVSAEQLCFYDPKLETLTVDELIMPANLRTGGRLHSMFGRATRDWVERILPRGTERVSTGRYFVSRGGVQSGRNLGNRSAIEGLATSAGFDIVHPERLDIADQIALFRGARQVVGEYGSGLHSTIYGGPALHCCALRGTCQWLGFIQSSLAHACEQTVSYVFGHAEESAVEYTFDINPENFRRALQSLEAELALR